MKNTLRPTRSLSLGATFITALACLAATGPALAAPLAVGDNLAVETVTLLAAGIISLVVTRRHASRQT